MSIDEAARLHLYEQARAQLGQAAADTLMQAVPCDPELLATKQDLAVLSAGLRGEMKALNADLLHRLFFGMVASNATLVGLVFAAVRLA